MTEDDSTKVRLRPAIAVLPPYRQGKPAPSDGFKLSSNENPYPPLPSVLDAITQAATQVNRYPDATARLLRERLAVTLSDAAGADGQTRLSSDEVHIGSGSVSLLAQLISAAAGAGDEVVYSWRSFEAYPGLVTVAGATSVLVPNHADGSHDLKAMAAAVTERTRVLIVCTPNNPTSTTVSKSDFEALMDSVPSTVLVVLDEAYCEFVRGSEAVNGLEYLKRYPNLVTLRTFSKAYGLAGLRIGYAFGPKPLLDAARSTAIPLSVTGVAVAAALASLEPVAASELKARVDLIVAKRSKLRATLLSQGWDIPEAQGNFIWLPTGAHTSEVAEQLFERGVVIRAFADDGIRISIGEDESVDVLVKVCGELVGKL